MDARDLANRRAAPPGGADDPQDAADLLQVQATSLGGAQPGGSPDPYGLF